MLKAASRRQEEIRIKKSGRRKEKMTDEKERTRSWGRMKNRQTSSEK